MAKCTKTRDGMTSSATEQSRQTKMLEACISLLEAELDLLKQKELTSFDMEIVLRKVADVKGYMDCFVDGLRRGTFDSYDSIRHIVDQLLLAISKRLKKVFYHKANTLPQGVHDALCRAAGGVQKPVVDAPEVVYGSLSLIIGHLKHNESAEPGYLPAHSANLEQRQSRTMAAADSGSASVCDTPRNSMPVSSIATDPFDYPDCCYLTYCKSQFSG